MAPIEPGSVAPDFTLLDQRGVRRSLSDYRGRVVVLYFYPKDDTEVCTKQACEFRDRGADFDLLDTAVMGISPDDEVSHRKFADKFALEFPLLADTERDDQGAPRVCDQYGVWQLKTLYGRTYMGVVRTTYVIDAAGIVHGRWDRVRIRGHIAEVLRAATKAAEGPSTKNRQPAVDRVRRR